jgi:hypothetical protein
MLSQQLSFHFCFVSLRRWMLQWSMVDVRTFWAFVASIYGRQ